MRQCIERENPDAVVHLGDHYDDGQRMAEEYPHIRFHLLPGNCDRYHCPMNTPQVLCYDVCGVRLFMTHGHLHNVKYDIGYLLADAMEKEAAAVLFGHTHTPLCQQYPDLLVMNPGSCGSGGSAGVIEVADHKITACRLLRQADSDCL